jgi:hypothetical protein
MTDETGLHVYGNNYECVIAASLYDAAIVYCESTGEPWSEQVAEELDFEQYADNTMHRVWCDANGDPGEIDGDGCSLIEKTCAEWAKRGRGFLSTTEQ